MQVDDGRSAPQQSAFGVCHTHSPNAAEIYDFVPRYHKFESTSLQRRVCELSVPERSTESLVDGSPQPVFYPGDFEHDLIQMPFVANLRQAATDLVGKLLAEFELSSARRAASSSGCVGSPRGHETGLKQD